MTIEPKQFLSRMKEHEFIYDTKLGKVVNKQSEQDKEYVFKTLDLLEANFDRVRYVDDLSDKVIGKNNWAVLISQKYAMMDKRMPIPQVPFHLKFNGKNSFALRNREAYYMLVGFLQESNEEICVSLNFRDEECRKEWKALIKETARVE